ncbi:unnamed protein product [Adineta steineri]|uniref:Inositol polyphosphate-related phosphatase domain-containing protein n=2 Tax=Adineta steineri TaxID=433720 RepID=A0A815ISJ1_9BILA|nr:unnamed protein product [Adineta steineri]CAF3701411.1 unnamed protein product [Adineta steineri]
MADDVKEDESGSSQLPSTSPLPVTEESANTIAALVCKIPLIEQESTNVPSTDSGNRRRSSFSKLQALISSSHLLPIPAARGRNFLVGSGQQLPESVTDDLSYCFPSGRPLTIMMVTWNIGEASKLYEQNYTPTDRQTAEPKQRMLDDMSDILLPTCIDYVSDLIIICTQEVSVTKKGLDWEVLLQEVIGPKHVLFHSIHFGTLSLCIFLRRDLIWFCSEPEDDVIKFRAVGPVRTKASLAVTFNLFGTSFMVINSHFEAGEGSEGRSNRRLNFENTVNKLTIPHSFVQRTVLINKHLSTAEKTESIRRIESTTSLDSAPYTGVDMTKSCDCVLWGGDLNFRINMSHNEVVELCKEQKYDQILENDEFRTHQKSSGGLYADFKEATIEFPPTYKFDLRSTTDNYTKNRTPSYTDRILYRDKPTSLLDCTQYKSIQGVKHSDHKPVIAHFRIKLKPALHTENLSYGKFNREVYKRGCEQRERHHSLGVGLRNTKRRTANARSSVCVLQ